MQLANNMLLWQVHIIREDKHHNQLPGDDALWFSKTWNQLFSPLDCGRVIMSQCFNAFISLSFIFCLMKPSIVDFYFIVTT